MVGCVATDSNMEAVVLRQSLVHSSVLLTVLVDDNIVTLLILGNILRRDKVEHESVVWRHLLGNGIVVISWLLPLRQGAYPIGLSVRLLQVHTACRLEQLLFVSKELLARDDVAHYTRDISRIIAIFGRLGVVWHLWLVAL